MPVINDSVYGFQAVNVEAQKRSPFSLLNWMKRLIQVRKAHRALGRGSIEFLRPENDHVLAYLREYEGDVVLIVGNLSASAQSVQLDLSRFAGSVPVELLGATEFLPIDTTPYALTLSPYGFFWFAIRAAGVDPRQIGDEELAALNREWAEADAKVMANTETVAGLVAEMSPDWLNAQRWFRSKARDVTAIESFDSAAIFPETGPAVLMAIIRVSYAEAGPEYYLMPLTLRPPPRSEDRVAILTVTTASRELSLYEAMRDPGSALTLLGLIEAKGELQAGLGHFRGQQTPAFQRFAGDTRTVRLLEGEQSNTSVVFGEEAVIKVFRKLEAGVNPDLEISRFLVTHTNFRAVPALMGSIEFIGPAGATASVAGLFRYVANRGNAWTFAIKTLDRFFNAASRNAADPYSAAGRAALRRMAGEFFGAAEALGRATGEMHLALASAGQDEPDFVREPISLADAQHWVEGSQRDADAILEELGRRLNSLPGAFPGGIHNQLGAMLRDAPDIRQSFEDLRLLATAGVEKIRIHGDYHLGQILRATDPEAVGSEWIILDFEGEPARPLSERRAKVSPMRDVAGMLRSFDYAVQVAIRNHGTDDFIVRNSLHVWGGLWLETARTAFLDSYRSTVAGAGLAPDAVEPFNAILGAFELDKAIYELGYEMNNRPDWLWVPLHGILAIRARSE
jgi:maltose alpha-D-glucosyltransferase/alpha-amylase